MKSVIFTLLMAISFVAQAECSSRLPLKGVLAITNCAPAGPNCIPGEQAMHDYAEAQEDDGPEVLSIALHGSPWHLYGPEFHILEVDELADMVRQQGSKIKRVVLYASWSGVSPEPNGKSTAQKLSAALGGMPVTGQDGFAWFAKDGKVSTTRQAFTNVQGGPYNIPKGDKVMASLTAGWFVFSQDVFEKEKNAAGMMRVGVGADVYLLCPERALKAFEAGAEMSNPVAAYNAAILRLERGKPGDREAAVLLLRRSAALHDRRAETKLASLRAAGK